jgi:hypothetical protein
MLSIDPLRACASCHISYLLRTLYHLNMLQASGGDWKKELLFAVPRDHPEMQRLEGKYKKWGPSSSCS